ncbi:hypothetical protein [Sinomonas sp. P10A9]|uniref:Secreted protein n=1 Tax=Sinomonas puerhi TaxID=3238584 RepID=A0AB39L039_9MICC
MATLAALIVAAAVVLAVTCLGNAVAVHLGRLRARRDAETAVTRLNGRYQDAVREMRRRR